MLKVQLYKSDNGIKSKTPKLAFKMGYPLYIQLQIFTFFFVFLVLDSLHHFGSVAKELIFFPSHHLLYFFTFFLFLSFTVFYFSLLLCCIEGVLKKIYSKHFKYLSMSISSVDRIQFLQCHTVEFESLSLSPVKIKTLQTLDQYVCIQRKKISE